MRNIVAKTIGSTNPINVVIATVKGLMGIKSASLVSKMRGKRIYNSLSPVEKKQEEV